MTFSCGLTSDQALPHTLLCRSCHFRVELRLPALRLSLEASQLISDPIVGLELYHFAYLGLEILPWVQVLTWVVVVFEPLVEAGHRGQRC